MSSVRTSVILSTTYKPAVEIKAGSQSGTKAPIGYVEIDDAGLTIQSTEPAELRRLADALLEAARQVEERLLVTA